MKRCTPTFLSICHGGISRAATLLRMERAHGRVSSYVMRDIGAMLFSRWHTWHERCRMGATSFVNVTSASCAAALPAAPAAEMTTAAMMAPILTGVLRSASGVGSPHYRTKSS